MPWPSSSRTQLQHHDEAHIGDERKRMRRIDRQRRQHRENPLHEPGVEPVTVLGASDRRRRTARSRPRASKPPQLAPDALLVRRAALGPRLDLGQAAAAAVRPSGEQRGDAGLGLADQPGDADRVEFIQVRRADGQRSAAAPAADGGGSPPPPDPVVEVEPGQFAVDEPLRVVPGIVGGAGAASVLGGGLLWLEDIGADVERCCSWTNL